MKQTTIFQTVTDYSRIKNTSTKGKSAPSIPYMGNKQAIANQIVNCLPKCEKFLDACCGGGSIGYTMLVFGIANHVTMNDLYKPLIDLHVGILNKKIDFENLEWCSRDRFKLAINRCDNGNYTIEDVIFKYCYSFGNNGINYLFSKELEPFKKQLHDIVCGKAISERRASLANFIRLKINSLDVQRLQQLEQLEQLGRLGRLEFTNNDIFEIDYSQYDCVYFDIPYENTHGYNDGKKTTFNHDKFWDFFSKLPELAFASSYVARDYITEVASFEKKSLFNNNQEKKKIVTEKLFCNNTNYQVNIYE